MGKSLKFLIGRQLVENGYKMKTANHFEKKFKNFYFCIDKDIADHLLIRLLRKNDFGETICIKNNFINGLSLKNQNELMNLVFDYEKTYQNLINN